MLYFLNIPAGRTHDGRAGPVPEVDGCAGPVPEVVPRFVQETVLVIVPKAVVKFLLGFVPGGACGLH